MLDRFPWTDGCQVRGMIVFVKRNVGASLLCAILDIIVDKTIKDLLPKKSIYTCTQIFQLFYAEMLG